MVEGAEFAAMTDSGTSFARGCLAKQVAALNACPGCAGVTGHQRIGQTAFYNDFEGSSGGVIPKLLHGFQTMEKELGSTAWHFMSYFGFLPVLHGQCNVWRMTSLSKPVPAKGCLGKSVLDIFEGEMDSLKSTLSLFGANLFLVEDRLLCLLAVMLSGDMKFIPDAVFYYRSEKTLSSLFSQRRRWNNGTAVAHIETLRLIYRFWDTRSLTLKLVAGGQCLAQLGSDVALACITPAVQCHTLMACVEMLAREESILPWQGILDYEQITNAALVAALFMLMMLHRFSGNLLSGLLVSVTVACIAVSVACVSFVLMTLPSCLGTCCPTKASSAFILMAIVATNFLHYFCFVVHSLIGRDTESISLVFKHLPACLFWHAYGWFVTFHASVFHLISWGNRPDDTKARNGMCRSSLALAMCIFFVNASAIVLRRQFAQLLPYVYLSLAGPIVLTQLAAIPLRALVPKG